MNVTLNREPARLDGPETTVRGLLVEKNIPDEAIVVAVNGDVVRRDEWDRLRLDEGDEVEIVHAVAGGAGETGGEDELVIAGESFSSRLFLGTGKYPDGAAMGAALEASGTEMVTVAVRHMDLTGDGASILGQLDLSRYRLLPNTAGATTAEQAVKMARMAREATGTNWLKLEVIGDKDTLWPDTAATVEATKVLVDEGFVVLPYTSPDLVAAIRLEEAGASAVMPLASPIGSGLGMVDWSSIRRMVERISSVPVVVDAGIGVPSDAAVAMDIGADALLVNTAIARAENPALMAEAMRKGAEAGRLAHLAGRMPVSVMARPSSTTRGVPARSAS